MEAVMAEHEVVGAGVLEVKEVVRLLVMRLCLPLGALKRACRLRRGMWLIRGALKQDSFERFELDILIGSPSVSRALRPSLCL